jgi:Cutinase
MTIAKPGSALLGLALAALAMAGVVPSAGAVSVRPALDLQAAAAAPSSVIFGQACPDVMVIGARGTNQGPKGDNNLSAYAKDPYHGVGATVYSMYLQLETANPKLVFSLEPAVYPTIFGGKNLQEFFQNAGQYLGDAQIGAESIAREIQDTDAACGSTVHYILVGYSLGAWAVHDALHIPGIPLGEIAGVALFGDPLFQPLSPIVRDYQSSDFLPGLAVLADPGDVSIPAIPASLSAGTGSWCLPGDPVCQALIGNQEWQTEFEDCVTDAINNNHALPCTHLDYPDAETAKAAAFLQPFLPPPTAPDTPGNVTAVATSQYKIQVTWTEATADVTGFNLDNGCPVGSCDPGATLVQTTGPVDSATFSVTPGSYQCFRVQAVNTAGTSPWSGFGCISTPGLVLSATQKWTNTKVTVPAGDEVGISADGQITVSPTETVGPAGDPSCTPAQN